MMSTWAVVEPCRVTDRGTTSALFGGRSRPKGRADRPKHEKSEADLMAGSCRPSFRAHGRLTAWASGGRDHRRRVGLGDRRRDDDLRGCGSGRTDDAVRAAKLVTQGAWRRRRRLAAFGCLGRTLSVRRQLVRNGCLGIGRCNRAWGPPLRHRCSCREAHEQGGRCQTEETASWIHTRASEIGNQRDGSGRCSSSARPELVGLSSRGGNDRGQGSTQSASMLRMLNKQTRSAPVGGPHRNATRREKPHFVTVQVFALR